MSSLFRTLPQPGDEQRHAHRPPSDPWFTAIGAVSGVLLVAGVLLVVAGLVPVEVATSDGTVDAVNPDVVLAGALAMALGVLVGTVWLVLGSLRWRPTR